MRKILLALFSALCSIAQAYDVEVDGIFYNVFGGRYCYVTSREPNSEVPCYAGDIVVPAEITFRGSTYTVMSVAQDAFALCEKLTSVQFPPTVKGISACAFIGCTGLRSVSLPAGLTAIAGCAFTGCTALQQVTLPRRAELVDSLSFYCCASLKSLVLPHRIRTVCYGSLEHLPSLTDLYCFASLPPMVQSHAFALADQRKCTLHVPSETLHLYQQAAGWADFLSIVPLTDADYAGQNYRKGDVNDDGLVDDRDLELLRRIVVSLPDDSAVRWAADVNGDGIVNAVDFVAMSKLL